MVSSGEPIAAVPGIPVCVAGLRFTGAAGIVFHGLGAGFAADVALAVPIAVTARVLGTALGALVSLRGLAIGMAAYRTAVGADAIFKTVAANRAGFLAGILGPMGEGRQGHCADCQGQDQYQGQNFLIHDGNAFKIDIIYKLTPEAFKVMKFL